MPALVEAGGSQTLASYLTSGLIAIIDEQQAKLGKAKLALTAGMTSTAS